MLLRYQRSQVGMKTQGRDILEADLVHATRTVAGVGFVLKRRERTFLATLI